MLVEPVLHHGTPLAADAPSPGYGSHSGAQPAHQRLPGFPLESFAQTRTGSLQLPALPVDVGNQALSNFIVQRLEDSFSQFNQALTRELAAHFERIEALLASVSWPAQEPAAECLEAPVLTVEPALPARSVLPAPQRESDPHTRILVVGTDAVRHSQLHALLAAAQGFLVIPQVADPSSAVPLARRHQPEMTLIDMDIDEVDPMLDLVSQLSRCNPGMHIVLITDHSDREVLLRALRLGVRAVLQRDLDSRSALHILRSVVRGEQVFAHPQALGGMLVEFRQLMQDQEQARFHLTDQEIEILRLAAVGLNNKEIGTRQFWSEITIKRKMGEIYRKLGVKSRAQAVAEAVRLGLI